MSVDASDSPIHDILARADVLALSAEQRSQLELLDIDFRSEAVRLSSERQLLELDALRRKAGSSSGIGFTVESLADFDARTAALRQAWLRAVEQARAVLSAQQLAQLPEIASKLPSSDTEGVAPDAGSVEEQITKAMDARLKDAKVLEIETAQAIAERLIDWAKSAAIVTAVPLALMAAVLAIIGVGNWTDFTHRIAEAKKDAEAELNLAKQGAESQLELAKKSANETALKGAALQAQYAALEKQFGEVSNLASKVGVLEGKVHQLEEIEVKQSSALISPETIAVVKQQIEGYRNYLQILGYHPPSTNFEVDVDESDPMNAYYDGQRMVVGPKLTMMPDVLYHDYTFRMLKEIKPQFWETNSWKIASIYYAFSDYFPCSFLGISKFGEKYVEAFSDKLAPELRSKGNLRDLSNRRSFVSESANVEDQEQHKASEPWSAAFWEIRTILGCKSDTGKCEDADKLLYAAIIDTRLDSANEFDKQLARSVARSVGNSFGAGQATKVRDVFVRRGLQLAPLPELLK